MREPLIVAEWKRIQLLNAPVRQQNRLARAHNKVLIDRAARQHPDLNGAELKAMLAPRLHRVIPLPHRLPPEVVTHEAEVAARLRRRGPLAWQQKLEALQAPRGVASIVWWDFFSLRNSSESQRWSHLDHLIGVGGTDEEIIQGLRSLGYTTLMAYRRVIGMEEDGE